MTEDDKDKLTILEDWKDALVKDIASFDELIGEQLERKRHAEEILAKKMRPVINKISKFTKQQDAVRIKIRRIDEEIDSLKAKSVD